MIENRKINFRRGAVSISPLFRYHTRDANGIIKNGEIEALNEDAVVKKLHEQGLIVISIKLVEQQEQKFTNVIADKPAEEKITNKLNKEKEEKSEMKTADVIIIIILALLLISNIYLMGKPKPVKWEYIIGSSEDVKLESDLKTIGDSGWEIAFARRAITGEGYSAKGIYEFIFKRPKQEYKFNN